MSLLTIEIEDGDFAEGDVSCAYACCPHVYSHMHRSADASSHCCAQREAGTTHLTLFVGPRSAHIRSLNLGGTITHSIGLEPSISVR